MTSTAILALGCLFLAVVCVVALIVRLVLNFADRLLDEFCEHTGSDYFGD